MLFLVIFGVKTSQKMNPLMERIVWQFLYSLPCVSLPYFKLLVFLSLPQSFSTLLFKLLLKLQIIMLFLQECVRYMKKMRHWAGVCLCVCAVSAHSAGVSSQWVSLASGKRDDSLTHININTQQWVRKVCLNVCRYILSAYMHVSICVCLLAKTVPLLLWPLHQVCVCVCVSPAVRQM